LSVDASKADKPSAQGRVIPCRIVVAWSLVRVQPAGMQQHPKLTLDWALRCLERALTDLDDGPAERRVRRQFHQLLLAIERDAGDERSSETSLDDELARVR
jgi:hypothetical protein